MPSRGRWEEGIEHWLEGAETELRLDIDRRSCLLDKAGGGIGIVFGLGLSCRDSRFLPHLLLRIASLGSRDFPGALAIDPEGGECVLVKRMSCSESAEQDGADLLLLVERMANQADVWCDLLERHGASQARQPRSAPTDAAALPLGLSLRLSDLGGSRASVTMPEDSSTASSSREPLRTR